MKKLPDKLSAVCRNRKIALSMKIKGPTFPENKRRTKNPN
jgi:hypothetical protein